MISFKKKPAKYYPFVLAFFVFFIAFPLQAQLQKTNPTLSYEHKGLKVNLTESENQFVVAFEKNFDYSNVVRKYDLKCVYRPLADSALYHVHMAEKPIVFRGDTKKIRNLGFENVSDLTNALRKQEGVVAAYPMVLAEDGTPQAYTNKVIIKLKSTFDNRNTQVILNNLGIQPDSWQPLLVPNSYAVLTQKNISAIALTKRLEKNAFIEYAEPDFVLFLKRLNDPLYPKQWSLNNLGAASHPNGIPDADIDAPEAWTITKGNSNIKVAVLDEGVELNHPDLDLNMLPGFDATGLGSEGQCNSEDSHGTACAGIIAAIDSNNIGIKGIAPRCKIVPVRIAYAGGGGWVTDNSTIANGITWAYTTGKADILSNSWGGGSPSNLIINAIENAVSLGRNGFGAIVLFSSGNDNSSVTTSYQPAIPEVISVASTSMCNERKSESSCDGEYYWGANYGKDLDIAAPGVKINTTDNIGGGGYNPNGDYYATFNGTSSACPHAAGVMALILSVNGNLTAAQARRVIEKSCDKVGGYDYQSLSGHPNGTWSFDLGYGKINAYKAVLLAQQNSVIASFSTPQQLFNTTTASVPFTNLSANAVSYQWFFPGGTPGTSTAFQPTVTYQSMGSYDVTLIATSASGAKDTLHIPSYITLSDQVLMQNGSVSTCNALFYDEGGATGNYSNNSEKVLTINSAVAGNKVSVKFLSFSLLEFDYLQIYDGTGITSPLIGSYSAYYPPQTAIMATNASGALTFRFISDSDGAFSGWVAQLSCYEPIPMVIQSITANHPTMATAGTGTNTNQILRIAVETKGELNPLNLTQFNLNTNGSTNPLTDIGEARLYYTGKSTYFSTNTAFGTTFIDPNGAFSIGGNQALQTGLNYFWLVYDIKNSAQEDNIVDAQLSSVAVAGNNHAPTNGNPVGSRTIVSHILMKNGSVTTCNGVFYDEGGIDGSYLSNSNQVLTINPAITGNKVRVQFILFSFAPSDFIQVYDGTGTNAPLIAAYSQSNYPQTAITATNASGALTFRFTSNGSENYNGWAANVTCHLPVPMVFDSITVTHPTTTAVGIGANNNRILRIAVHTKGQLNPLYISKFNLNTAGSTSASTDISGARLYYTGNSDVFATNIAFGTAVTNPNGVFSVNGNQPLQIGLNYFWLVYDIKSNAVVGNVVDAQLSNAVVTGIERTPTNGNPIGSRTIENQIVMKNGSVTTCNAVFYDEGGADGDYLNSSSKVLTINPATVGTRVRVQFTHFDLESDYYDDLLYIYDGTSTSSPLIGVYTGYSLLPTITATNATGALTFSFTSGGSYAYSGWVAQISCYQPVPMAFQSMTAVHTTTAAVGAGTNNNRMLRIVVNINGDTNPLNVTQLNFSTSGSTNASTDISGARLYYTGNSNLFETTTAFGTVVTNPNGTFSFSGSSTLQAGLNYFWLVYDTKSSAVIGNVIDAQLLSAVVAGTNRTPINGNPVGSRGIANHLLMRNGSVTTCDATFYDEGGADGSYPNNSSKVLTINPAVAGSKVRVQFTAFSLDYDYYDVLEIYDGTGINSSLIGSYSGSFLPPTITATNASGALTFRFVSDSYSTSSGWTAQISCYQPVPMVFQSMTATHPTTAAVGIGSNDNRMLRIAVNVNGDANTLNITQFNLNTAGSTNAATDISGARLYYTGKSDIFSPDSVFGNAVTNPNGTFSISGNGVLQSGTNYFWLVYDIKNSASAGNVVDAQLSSAVVGGANRTPTNGNPVGSRTIANQVLMQNGSVSTCNATFYDDGGVDAYLNNSDKVLTIKPAVAGNKVRVQFTSFSVGCSYYACEYLLVYDGDSTDAPLIGSYTGFSLPPTITATNAAGALTFKFTSDDEITYSGWVAQISCCPVIPTPTITVTGNTNLCNGGSVLLTAPAGYGYLWSNGETSQSITVNTTGAYTVKTLVGDCISEVSSAVKVQEVASLLDNIVLSATPDTVVSIGQSVTLSSVVKNGNLKITEITLNKGGTGRSLPYPSWVYLYAARFVEITNVGNSPMQLSNNISLQGYIGSSVLVNYPLPNISLNAGEVAVFNLGTGTNDPANKYFNTGAISTSLSSSTSVGFVLKNNSTQQIIDAVALNKYAFPASSGVTSADWSGAIIDLSSFAGASLQGLDNNNGSSWVRSSAANPQNIGNVNANLILNNLNFNWTGSNGFTATGGAVNTGALNTLGTHTFTANATVGNCSFSKAIKIRVVLTSVTDPINARDDIQLYPNPSVGDFTLVGKSIEKLELFDAKGRLVYQRLMPQASSETISVELNGAAQGVYFLKIFTTNSVVTKRLIIQ